MSERRSETVRNFLPGYCTNIHAGVSLPDVIENLMSFSVPVKEAYCPDQSMGIGLWFSAEALQDTLLGRNWESLRDCLFEAGLVPHTFNAFPYSDFHQPVVKHQVYQPDWTTEDRTEYTKSVAKLQERLLPKSSFGSISTVPLGWPHPENCNDGFMEACAANMSRVAKVLNDIRLDTGKEITLCIEPEPGCILQTSDQLIHFFDRFLFQGESAELNRNFIAVCHDVCHAAVMFEKQTDVLQSYLDAGIKIGKVQVSSAVEADMTDCDSSEVADSLDALREFIEPRYLHQTMIQNVDQNGETSAKFYEDLPLALASASDHSTGRWRVHFHVPIQLKTLGALQTTQADIIECIEWLRKNNVRPDLEVETYAWNVSPDAVQGGTMVDSLVNELNWLKEISAS